MKKAVFALPVAVMMLLVATTYAAILQVEIPANLVAPLQQVCAEVQQAQRFPSFTDEECAVYLVRLGSLTWRIEKAKIVTRASQRTAIRDAIQAELDLFDQNWPLPSPVECGNGEIENVPALNHVEECDDGNLDPGDGCSAECMNE
jgi:cysteine-rich repeat protein